MMSNPTPVVNTEVGYQTDRWSVGAGGSFSKDEQSFQLTGGLRF